MLQLVLVATPWHYDTPSLVSFEQVMYKLPCQWSQELHSWLVSKFKLTLDPPCFDGYTDDDRLEALMLKCLSGQAHTLWHSIKNRDTLGVVGAKFACPDVWSLCNADKVITLCNIF